MRPDIALLQEVSALPPAISERFDVLRASPLGKAGRPQRFSNVTLSSIGAVAQAPLRSPLDWVQSELQRFSGNLLLGGLGRLSVVNVYSPAWPVDRERLRSVDTSPVKLERNPDVWVADLLWHALYVHPEAVAERFLAAGDFNLSETFDSWPGGPRGNREYLDRMAELGLVECLRTAQGRLTPTFRNPRGGVVAHQMDHLFVSPDLAAGLLSCHVGAHDEVFGLRLSDHLPIIASFDRSVVGGAFQDQV